MAEHAPQTRKKSAPLKKHGYAKTLAAQPLGSAAELVVVEADLTRGLHSFSIVGLADKAVAEASDRLSAALRHSGIKSPKQQNKRIVLSLSPADLKKEGAHYDLALAIAYLIAADELTGDFDDSLFIGELALDGTLRAVRGVLPQVLAAKKKGIGTIYVPPGNAREALLAEWVVVYAPASIADLIAHFKKEKPLPRLVSDKKKTTPPPAIDLSEVKGQESAKRALEIAAAGRHNIVFYGPPGTGKTMLARALAGILPPLTSDEMLEVTAIHSTAALLKDGEAVQWPPFRAPHHSVSHVAIVGGGAFPKAGEVTLAHKGVLFLDEFPEFDSRALEALRQPLEDRVVTVSRARATVTFPADCMIVAAMNPATLSQTTRVLRYGRPRSRRDASRARLSIAWICGSRCRSCHTRRSPNSLRENRQRAYASASLPRVRGPRSVLAQKGAPTHYSPAASSTRRAASLSPQRRRSQPPLRAYIFRHAVTIGLCALPALSLILPVPTRLRRPLCTRHFSIAHAVSSASSNVQN